MNQLQPNSLCISYFLSCPFYQLKTIKVIFVNASILYRGYVCVCVSMLVPEKILKLECVKEIKKQFPISSDFFGVFYE